MGLLHLFCRPEIGLVCLGGATAYGWYCQLITMLSPIFTSLYGFSADVNGALYATGGIGSGCGAIMASLISDRFYRWQIKRNGGTTVIEYRLTLIWLAIPFIVVGSLIYGWCLQFRRSFYVPIIGYFLCKYKRTYR
jgi:predicted MFS family arabinose efflux permease